jgi:uncharacterized protein YcbK (DUF882 family)
MYSGRTGESLDTIYWIDGKYIRDAVDEITHFMRDWRNNKVVHIDTRTIDIMSAAHNLMDVDAMLRRRSSGVARNSLHMKGQAADLQLKSRSVDQMARAAAACKAGGVGRYSRSDFVHMDCGQVRSWGR